MAPSRGESSIFTDVLEALQLVFRLTWRRNVIAWICVPFGVLIILLACFGVNSLISLSSVTFPASVACLVILFFALLICDSIIGDRRTRAIVSVVDIPVRLPYLIYGLYLFDEAGWALRYISLFFTPSFVLLPLSPPISAVEVGKIIAVFLLGFVAIFVMTAYIVRGLQLVFGSTKRAVHARAEEMGIEDDNIPLTNFVEGRRDSAVTPMEDLTATVPGENVTSGLIAPPKFQDPSQIRITGGQPEASFLDNTTRPNQAPQSPLPLSRAQVWATFINLNFDRLTWLLLFVFVGIPIYYSAGYVMPAQLSFNILAYFSALALPARWRQFLHPVLVSAAITIIAVWTIGLIRGDDLEMSLRNYKTGVSYLDLWHDEKRAALPGAGDIFGSILDASIVALALPMFSYRQELRRHFFAIFIPNITISIASLFGYPALCYAIGISSKRSLAFAARSLTLALATPAINNLSGDVNTGAALAIMSGIIGVLIGNRILAWLKIPEDDYVTRGVSLGANSSAIATALLLVSDPRAAALSSLSMSLFGIITLALTSVPAIVKAIQALVDM